MIVRRCMFYIFAGIRIVAVWYDRSLAVTHAVMQFTYNIDNASISATMLEHAIKYTLIKVCFLYVTKAIKCR